MSFREKVTIGCILAFASLSGIASIVRFPYISHFSGDKTKFFGMYPHLRLTHQYLLILS